MPKRKRTSIENRQVDLAEELELKKQNLEKKLVHGRKLLNRALKTAKGFERQKLGKRIKLAVGKKDEVESGRLQRELDVLKVSTINACEILDQAKIWTSIDNRYIECSKCSSPQDPPKIEDHLRVELAAREHQTGK